MFANDLDGVKEVFKRLFEQIGVHAVDYKGFDPEVAEYFGDYFKFQCEQDRFFAYCEDNNIKPKIGYVSDEYREYQIEINDNIYFTLVETI